MQKESGSQEYAFNAIAGMELRGLNTSKEKAEARLSECLSNMASEQAMLDSLLLEPETATNENYLRLAKKACRSGIDAWDLDIAFLKADIDMYTAKINAILSRLPAKGVQ